MNLSDLMLHFVSFKYFVSFSWPVSMQAVLSLQPNVVLIFLSAMYERMLNTILEAFVYISMLFRMLAYIWHNQVHGCSPLRVTSDNSWIMNLHLQLGVISYQFGIWFPWSGVKLSAETILAVTSIVTLDESNKKKKKKEWQLQEIFFQQFLLLDILYQERQQ